MSQICYRCFQQTVGGNGICSACGFDSTKNREQFPLALPMGSVLFGRYIVGQCLGQGGFGITYLAQDYQTKERVAIKEFFPGAMATRNGTTIHPYSGVQGENFNYGKNTFLDEAQTMAQFNGNPNIAGVQIYFEENGTAYFVMEYLDGCSLQQYIAAHGGRLSWEETSRIMMPVLEVLSQIHEKDVIHRDIAPDNIYITKDGSVKVLDFGAARHSLGNVSQSLDVVVKHGFAPKEQYSRRGRQGPFTDVYATCATMYYALTGVKPDESIDRLENDTMPAPSILGAKISQQVESVLMKGLSVNPQDRYQSAAELMVALTKIGASVETSLPKTEIIPPSETRSESAPEAQVKSDSAPAQETNQNALLQRMKGWIQQQNMTLLAICTVVAVALLSVGAFFLFHTHSFDTLVESSPASCESEGYKIQKCNCGKEETTVLKATGHTETRDPGTEATCTESGWTDGVRCEKCNKVLVAKQKIPATSHQMESVAAVQATCTANGYSAYEKCTKCGYTTGRESTKSLGHSFSKNACSRCDTKEWYVEFTTTQKEFKTNERIEVDFVFKHYSTLPSSFFQNAALINPQKLKAKFKYNTKLEYSNGQVKNHDKKYFNKGEEIETGQSWTVYWDKTINSKATVTLSIYTEDDVLIGSYTFTVK